MGSSFEPGNTKNTRENTLLHSRDLQVEPGRWQNFTYKVPAQLLALLAIFSVQMGAAVGEGLFSAIGPLGTTFLRLGFAAIMLLLLWRPQVRGLTRAQYINVLLFGIVLAAMNGAFYSAIRLIPLGVAVTLEFVGPLGLALVQSRRVKDVVWALLAMVGILLLAPIGHEAVNLIGAGLAIMAGIFWAAYIVCSARVGAIVSGWARIGTGRRCRYSGHRTTRDQQRGCGTAQAPCTLNRRGYRHPLQRYPFLIGARSAEAAPLTRFRRPHEH